MKHIVNPLKYLAAIALLVLAVGCISNQQNKENLAVAAGFKLIAPSTPDQVKTLQSLPSEQVTPITYKGKQYFVLPDAEHNQAYVGRAQEYQAFQELRLQQHLSNQNLQAAQMNQMAAMNTWGGWRGWGRMGW